MNFMKFLPGKLHLLLCLTCAVYMIYQQCKAYIENKDSSSVLYRQFSEEVHDNYPTWSICFTDYTGHIFTFNKDRTKPTYETTEEERKRAKLYRDMLMGYENITSNFSSLEYDDSVKHVLAILWKGMSSSQIIFDGKAVWRQAADNVSTIPFDLAYQDPNMMCFTKRDELVIGKKREYDTIFMNLHYLYNQGMHLQFYFHHTGQLMKQLQIGFLHEIDAAGKKELMDTYRKKMRTPIRQYQLTEVEILNKRATASTPCDPDLKSEDSVIIVEIIKLVGCIPTYWKQFSILDRSLADYAGCDKQEQFQKFARFLPHFATGNHFSEKIQHSYMPPCEETKSWGKTTKNQVYPGALFFQKVIYVADVYKSITNNEAFSGQDLWSQIGGFVGIFLGYSLLQVTVYVTVW